MQLIFGYSIHVISILVLILQHAAVLVHTDLLLADSARIIFENEASFSPAANESRTVLLDGTLKGSL